MFSVSPYLDLGVKLSPQHSYVLCHRLQHCILYTTFGLLVIPAPHAGLAPCIPWDLICALLFCVTESHLRLSSNAAASQGIVLSWSFQALASTVAGGSPRPSRSAQEIDAAWTNMGKGCGQWFVTSSARSCVFMLRKCGYSTNSAVTAAHLLRGLAESWAWLAPDAPTRADADIQETSIHTSPGQLCDNYKDSCA